MESFINNPNLTLDIGHNIFHYLDEKSLKSCQLVNSSMKKIVNAPKFWLQKLDKKGLLDEDLKKWRKLASLVENYPGQTELIENVSKYLKTMYHWFSESWSLPLALPSVSPIFFASGQGGIGDARLIELIISENVDDLCIKNRFGQTPIDVAASHGHLEVVKVLMSALISSQAKVSEADNLGMTSIHYAASWGYLEVLKLLIPNVNNLNIQAQDGKTPIYYAAQNGYCEVVRILMTSTENPNTPDNDGITPLHVAASWNSGHVDV